MSQRLSQTATANSNTPPIKRHRPSDPDVFLSPPASTPRLETPSKRRKVHRKEEETYEQDIDALRSPQFWDNLTRIPLVKAAVAELDRRNRQETITHPSPASIQSKPPADPHRLDCDLQRYARQGGPDLSGMRGAEEMPDDIRGRGVQGRGGRRGRGARGRVQKPPSRESKRSSRSRSKGTIASKDTTGPYDAAFKQHLIDYKIWPIGHYLETGEAPPPPDNLGAIVEFINGGRASLEPEVFTQSNFAAFQKSYNLAASEEARSRTLEMVEGLSLALSSTHIKRGPVNFTNLKPLTPGNIVPGYPDRVFGSRPEKLHQAIRAELKNLALPTAAQDMACPNVIVHIKGPAGSHETAFIQAVYDGALAARGIEALRLLGDGDKEPAVVQHVARTLTCTFASGALRIYAVHIRSCTGTLDSSLQNVEYITSLVGAWFLDVGLEEFRKGATAYRNAIEWAQIQREEVIDRANRAAAAEALGPSPVSAMSARSASTGNRPGSSSSVDQLA